MTNSRIAIYGTLIVSAALFSGACEDDEPLANQEGGAAGAGEGGDGSPAAGGTPNGAGTGSGGTTLGGATGVVDGGAGGAAACIVVECEGLDEATCRGLDLADDFKEGGCRAVQGSPWGTTAGAAGVGQVDYAGCATRCCGPDCEEPTSGGCAHPAGDPTNCWTLTSSLIPDGWVLLTDVDDCRDFPQCSP